MVVYKLFFFFFDSVKVGGFCGACVLVFIVAPKPWIQLRSALGQSPSASNQVAFCMFRGSFPPRF